MRTTLDVDAQRVAFEALGGQRGAVVAIEPATGRIRAWPPTRRSTRPRCASAARCSSSTTRRTRRCVNRTTMGQYPPGSTFKVVTATAAIDSGKFTKDTTRRRLVAADDLRRAAQQLRQRATTATSR